MTAKERNLVKGAIRRVFSRSDLRKSVIAASRVEHQDLSRPRVTKWSKCPICQQFIPTYLMECDHLDPIVPINTRLEDMDWTAVIDRAWCDVNNLKAVCKPCHRAKTKEENKLRRSRT